MSIAKVDANRSEPEAPRKTGRIRLEYLDGLRGLAALYVALCHTYFQVNPDVLQSPSVSLLPVGWDVLRHGHLAVGLFIVLSGYCLTLPVVNSPEHRLRGGLVDYIKRRARRILPPYFAALLLSLGLIALVPPSTGVLWRGMLPAFTPDVLLSHLLLLHNFGQDWMYKINYTLWTVAVEWQIYFVFALLLLPVRRRFGLLATVVASFVLAQGVRHLLPYPYEACAWYIGLFTLGMAGAEIGFSGNPQISRWRDRLPWGWLSGLFATVLIASLVFEPSDGLGLFGRDVLIGLGSVSALIHCTGWLQRGGTGRRPAVLTLAEAPALVGLGVFSYSLYLTHALVIVLVDAAFLTLELLPVQRLVVLLAIAIPLAVLFAYLFHRLFERRFMSAVALGDREPLAVPLAALRRLWQRATGTQTTAGINRAFLQHIGEQMAADTVTVLLAAPEQQLLVYASVGLEKEVREHVQIPIGRGVAGTIASERQPQIVENLQEVEVISPILRAKGLCSLVGVPIITKDRLLGVLHVGTTNCNRHFSPEDIHRLQNFAHSLEATLAT